MSTAGIGMLGVWELIIMLGFGGGVGLPLGVPPQPEDPLMARVAPDECLFYTTWSGIAAPDAHSENQTEQLLAEPEVQHLIAELQRHVKTAAIRSAGRDDPQAAALVDDASRWLPELLKNPAAIFVSRAGIGEAGPEVAAGAVFHVGDKGPQLETVLKRYQTAFLREAVRPVTIGDASYYRITLDPKTPPITWCVRGKYLLVGVGEGSLEEIMARANTAAPKWLTGLRAQLPVGRLSTVTYINLGRIRDTFAPAVEPNGPAVIRAAGLGNVTSLGSVTGLDQQGFVAKILLGVDGRPQGLLDFAAAAPLEAKDLAAIPADATFALAARVDVHKIFETFLSVLGEIEPRAREEMLEGLDELNSELRIDLREDLLKPLGDTWRVYNSPGEGGLILTGLTAVAKVDDRDRLAALQAKLMLVAKAALGEEDQRRPRPGPRIEQFEFSGQTVYFFNARDNEFPLAPAWCLTENELIVATFPQNVKSYLSRGADFRSLATVSEVSEALATAPGPVILAYVDTRALFELLYPFVPMIAQAACGELAREGIDVDVSIVPSAAAIGRHLRPGVAMVRRGAAGIEFTSRQTLPGGSIGTAAPLGVALLLPAVQSARAAARRAQSMNNLKQIGLAVHNHSAVHGKLPAAYSVDANDKPLLSWRVRVLPYIEEQALYEQFRLDEPWDSDHNKQLIPLMPQVYKAAGGNAPPGHTNYLAAAGEGTVFPGKQATRFQDVRDGSSHTIMVVEAGDAKAVPWTKPEDFQYDSENPVAGLVGLRPGGFNAAFCDGSVHFIHATIDADALKAMFTRAGGEAIDRSEF